MLLARSTSVKRSEAVRKYTWRTYLSNPENPALTGGHRGRKLVNKCIGCTGCGTSCGTQTAQNKRTNVKRLFTH
ncbi:hypothetical protein DBV15_00110 [Temnothorax longispinosus]|uniref:Uncharacterized protein n=1 Tax=Temnothorax longispinosus TaxID=300112 RepID=A0A4S2KDH0_9HYME|nr:hypothetical protein DBV15_00110 [Temnothorax longispinosus]